MIQANGNIRIGFLFFKWIVIVCQIYTMTTIIVSLELGLNK